MDDAASWGVQALGAGGAGFDLQDAVHICYGYGTRPTWPGKKDLATSAPVRKGLPGAAASSIDQVSLECLHSHVQPDLMAC